MEDPFIALTLFEQYNASYAQIGKLLPAHEDYECGWAGQKKRGQRLVEKAREMLKKKNVPVCPH